MRITNNMLVSNMTYNLNQTLQRLEKLQYEAGEGKKFRVPSDDPIGASKSLKFNTDISKVDQYLRNTKDAQAWMKETEGALNEINSVLHRVNELAVQAANGPNEAELGKIQDEIKELKEHMVQIGNATFAGRSLFTGYKTDEVLLKEDGSGSWEYNVEIKTSEIFEYNVGVAERVKINTLGNKIFGSVNPDGSANYTSDVNSGGQAYLIKMMEDFEEALTTKNNDGIQATLTNVKDSMDQVLSTISEIGARTNRLELTENKLEDQLISLKELLSFNEDVSLPDAIMRLSLEENAFRASLGVGGRIIQPSLMDFLR